MGNRLETSSGLASLLVVLLLTAACSTVSPKHEIPPRQDFILAGVQVGDTVEITTANGKQYKFKVTKISGFGIHGGERFIALGDITKLVKRSWIEPGHPCGAGEPVGCSIPEVVRLIEEYTDQAEKFHPACVTHDFCYRHGHATYGTSRAECDAVFLEQMKESCKGFAGLGVLDVKDHSICLVSATQTYEAVRKYGKQHFRTDSSTYCDYNWQP